MLVRNPQEMTTMEVQQKTTTGPHSSLSNSFPLLLLLPLLVILGAPPAYCDVFRECGGEVVGEKGVIHSPNFPHPYPDPISCLWIIRAPPGKNIHLYFTQYFIRESFYLSEFDAYTSPRVFTGRNDLGPFDFREYVTSVVGYKPILTIEFRARGKKNIHLRVEEFLNDVFGFNVTYEIVDASQPRRNDTCSVHECSYLGHCYAKADWSDYYCDCFDGYFGPECQYGPYCDPKAGRNMCLNGGSCRYFFGSYVNICECPPGYGGDQCEMRTDDPEDTSEGECASLGCSQLCEKHDQLNLLACACKDGYRLKSDNATCELIELHRVAVQLETQDGLATTTRLLSARFEAMARQQLDRILKHYRMPPSQRFRIDSVKISEFNRTLTFLFYMDSSHVRKLHLIFGHVLPMIPNLRLFNLIVEPFGLQLSTSPELRLLGVENYERRAAPVGSFSNLVCRARGSNHMQFRWLKDGSLVNSSLTTRNIWQMTVPEAAGHYHMSILNINDITIYDKGTFTCEAEDFGDVQRQDVSLDVVTSPIVIITPMAANVRKGDAVSFRCFSPDDRLTPFHYKWLKNGERVNPGEDMETLEDVQPTGKRLSISNAKRNANYTCVVSSRMASTSTTAHLFVTTVEERCEESVAMGITWKPAVHGGFDEQKCPKSMAGLARRFCYCNRTGCTWSSPSLARCQTAAYIAAFDKMEELLLGYQGQTMTGIYIDLLTLLRNTSGKNVIAGDVTLASRMVLNGLMSAVEIPDILLYAAEKLQPEQMFDVLGHIINMATTATPEEIKEQKILSRSLVALELVAELLGRTMSFHSNGLYNSSFMRAEMKEYRKHTPVETKLESDIATTFAEKTYNHKNTSVAHTNPETKAHIKQEISREASPKSGPETTLKNGTVSFNTSKPETMQNNRTHAANTSRPETTQNKRTHAASTSRPETTQNNTTQAARTNRPEARPNSGPETTRNNGTQVVNSSRTEARRPNSGPETTRNNGTQAVNSSGTEARPNSGPETTRNNGTQAVNSSRTEARRPNSGPETTRNNGTQAVNSSRTEARRPNSGPETTRNNGTQVVNSSRTEARRPNSGPETTRNNGTQVVNSSRTEARRPNSGPETTRNNGTQAVNSSRPEARPNSGPETTRNNGTQAANASATGTDTVNGTNEGGNITKEQHLYLNRSESTVKNETVVEKPFQVLEVVHVESVKLLDTPPPNKSENSHWLPLSRLRSVIPTGGLWETEHFRAALSFHHPMKHSLFEHNETLCFSLLNDRNSLEHEWSHSQCQVLFSGINMTTCVCSLPVHVTVFVRPRMDINLNKRRGSSDSPILLMGCIIALCGMTATLLAYLLAFRNLTSVYHIVRLNFILCLFIVLTVSITCLSGRQLQMLCLTGRLLLHLALLGAFSFLFVDTIHMYVIVHAQSARILSERCWKFLGIGWGIPVISVGSTALMSNRYGHNDVCYYWCWVDSNSWQFYPFLVPMLVLVLSSILMSVKNILKVCTWTDEWRFKSRKKHILRASKNGAVLVVLLGVTWAGCDAETEHGYGVQVVFIILLFALVGVVFTAYCVSERRVVEGLSVLIRRKGAHLRTNCSTNSFRAFMMPEKIVEEARNTEEQNIHRLCTEHDSRKYTSAKKRQLRFLLGSSSGSSESDESCRQVYSGAAMIVLPGSSRSDDNGTQETEELIADSGIFTATDSEKSSASVGHHSVSTSNRTGSCSDISEVSDALLGEQGQEMT